MTIHLPLRLPSVRLRWPGFVRCPWCHGLSWTGRTCWRCKAINRGRYLRTVFWR